MAWVSAVGRFGTATPGQCAKGPQVLPHATHRASPGTLHDLRAPMRAKTGIRMGRRGTVSLRLSAPASGHYLAVPTVQHMRKAINRDANAY